MANITAQMVKELREMTQAGMMDCKKALMEAEGEMEKAIEWLREKGLAAAAKKAGRIAAEGMVASYVSDDASVGVIVEVNCETDFVANTDNFKAFCAKVAKHIALAKPADVDELLAQKYVDDESKTITDLVSDATVAIGEKISIRRFARFETKEGAVESYIHMGGKIGVLVETKNDNPASYSAPAFKAFYHDVALQIAAARPSYVRKSEVPSREPEQGKGNPPRSGPERRQARKDRGQDGGRPHREVLQGSLPAGSALRQGQRQEHQPGHGRDCQGNRREHRHRALRAF